MKDVEEATEPEQPPTPKTPRLVLIFLALNLAATGFVAFKVLTMPTASGETEVAAASSDEPGPLFTMAPFVVNLNDVENPRFLKTTIDIEVRDDKVLELFDETRTKIIRDDVMSYLSSLKLENIMGEKGKIEIKQAILARLEPHFEDGALRRVLLSEFVVQ